VSGVPEILRASLLSPVKSPAALCEKNQYAREGDGPSVLLGFAPSGCGAGVRTITAHQSLRGDTRSPTRLAGALHPVATQQSPDGGDPTLSDGVAAVASRGEDRELRYPTFRIDIEPPNDPAWWAGNAPDACLPGVERVPLNTHFGQGPQGHGAVWFGTVASCGVRGWCGFGRASHSATA
jgi:hypothetical protein